LRRVVQVQAARQLESLDVRFPGRRHMAHEATKAYHSTRTAYRFLLPSVVTIALVILLPTILAAYITLNNVNLTENGGKFIFAGLSNYINLAKDSRFFNSLVKTILYVVGSVVVETVIALAICLFLERRFRGRQVVRTLIIVPMFVTPVVVALIWRMFYDPTSGMVNFILKVIGFGSKNAWLGSSYLALPAIVISDIWEWTPFMILIIMAGLESLPVDIFEAAYVDGASELSVIRYLTIPLIVPAMLVAVTFRTIDALKAFDLIWVMTKGGPGVATETTNLYAYTVGFEYFRIGYATTVAFVFTLVVTVIASNLVTRLFARARS
jgi:multiple sugar transport system permease protein